MLKKLNIPKPVVDYLVPAVLAIFLLYQFVAPAVSKTLETKRGIASVNAVAVRPVEVKPKRIPNGHYYNFKSDYSCFNEAKDKNIPSYFDAYDVTDNQVCHLGDQCNKNVKCTTRSEINLELAKDAASFSVERRKYIRQKGPIADSCVVPTCASLPETCRFDESPSLDENGCPAGCGTITCKLQTAKSCPDLNCAALPQGCEYDGKASLNANGCPTGCGKIVCDYLTQTEFKCANIGCPKLPENCRYDNTGKLDKFGCKTTCGQVICDRADPKKEQCPAPPSCSEPPGGCFYVGEPAVDKNGCRVGCGGISCKRSLVKNCAPPQCDPAPENCRYDGNAPLDFNGCLSNCGNLICNKN